MSSHEFECVDPEFGEQIHKLDDPALEPELRRELQQHLRLCHACSELRHFRNEVATQIAAQSLPGKRRYRSTAPLSAAVLLAAALILMLLLPSGQGYRSLLLRGGELVRGEGSEEFLITSPLEGEILYRQAPRLQWTPVEEASFYEVVVEWRNAAGDRAVSWTDSTRHCSLSQPESLGGEGNFLAIVKPYPLGLVEEQERSVSFSRRGFFTYLAYRFLHPPLISILLALSAVVLGVLLLFRRP